MDFKFELWVLSASSDLVSRDFTGVAVATDPGTTVAFTPEGASIQTVSNAEIATALSLGVVEAVARISVDDLLQLAREDTSLTLYYMKGSDAGLSDRFVVEPFDFFGTDGNDQLADFTGVDQDSSFFGFEADDRIGPFGGDDLVFGGPGTDTVVLNEQARYTLQVFEDFVIVTDRRGTDPALSSGTDTLRDVERLEFSDLPLDQPFNLTTFAGLTELEGPELSQFIELYIAYFNRAPDAVGLGFWGTAFANGTSLEESATLFVDQPETRAAYPEGTTSADFVTTVYNNVLGRQSDQAGFDFWVGVLENGSVSRDQFILELLRGAKADPPAGADQAFIDQQQADQAFLSNKTDLGTYFAVTLGMSNVENASAAMALYDGTQAGFDAAVAAIDGYYQAALDPVTGEFLFQVAGVLDNPIPITFEITGETIEVDEDGSIQFDAFENDIGTGLTLTTVSNPGNGTVDFPSPSSALFTYTPNPDFAGQDSFIYTVRDEQGREATATVNITVRDDDISGSAADAQPITTQQLFASELDGDFDADYFSLDLSTTNGTVFALALGGDAAGEAEIFIRPAGGQSIVESGADGRIIYAPDNGATTLDFVVATNASAPKSLVLQGRNLFGR